MAIIWSNWNHEPIDHLRRMGDSRISVFTLGEWLPQWYDRLHGEELIAQAAEMGINTIYTHFFKGFGLVHEHDDMERMREFIRYAHAHGVEVIGYCQLGTLYYETMLDEVPDLEDWIARDRNGDFLTYGGLPHYYRWRPCFESREFIAYFKRVLSYGVEHVGLDGFHFDNSQVRECYCPRCQQAFRDYLTAQIPNPREVTGLAHFRNVRIPPLLDGDEVHDPLCLWRGRFRHDQLVRAQTEIFDYVKAIGGKYVLHNPGLLRPDFRRAFDPQRNPASCDFVFAENSNYIRVEGEKTITQILSFKLGERFGFRVFDAPWMHKDGDYLIPDDRDTIDRFLTQGMIYGNITGAPWFVRSRKTADRVIMDDPAHAEIAARAFAYFKDHAALYDSVSAPRARLLYATDSFYGLACGFTDFTDAASMLEAHGVPYTVITASELAEVNPGELVVLANMPFAPRGQYDAIASAYRRGVRFLRLGRYGLYNEHGKERDHADPIRDLSALPDILTELPDDVRVIVSVPGILVETRVTRTEKLVLHLLRADNTDTLPEVSATLTDARVTGTARLYSVDDGCALRACTVDHGTARLTVTGLHTMASIEFR